MSDNSETAPGSDRIGTIYLTGSGTPVGRFDFVVDSADGSGVEVGMPCTAVTAEGQVVGIITGMTTIGRAGDPWAVNVAPDALGSTMSSIVAQVQVLYSEKMRPVPAGYVRTTTAEEFKLAMGEPSLKWPIPAGIVGLGGGRWCSVSLDGHTLLGPEGASMCIGGVSGLAAKSSYTSVLLRGAIHASREGDTVAGLIINVKGGDYLNLDKPAEEGSLTEDDLALYTALGVPAAPFPKVTVYSPALPGSAGTYSGVAGAKVLKWDFKMIYPYMKYLLGDIEGDEKLASFFADFEDKLLTDTLSPVNSFNKLEAWFKDVLDTEDLDDATPDYEKGGKKGGEGQAPGWGYHHRATLQKLRRMLLNIPARGKGLFAKDVLGDSSTDVPTSFEPGELIVVDVSYADPTVQALVIARTLERVLESAFKDRLGVDHLAICVDELNTFAPQSGGDLGTVRKVLAKVSSQGRFSGLGLFASAQQLSKVADAITTNASSRALGRTSDVELSSGAYGRIPTGIAEVIATAAKGEMTLWSIAARVPITVKFPRPAWKMGKIAAADLHHPTTAEQAGVSEKTMERLREGLNSDMVEAILATTDGGEEAVQALLRERKPDMSRIKASARRKPDPFQLD